MKILDIIGISKEKQKRLICKLDPPTLDPFPLQGRYNASYYVGNRKKRVGKALIYIDESESGRTIRWEEFYPCQNVPEKNGYGTLARIYTNKELLKIYGEELLESNITTHVVTDKGENFLKVLGLLGRQTVKSECRKLLNYGLERLLISKKEAENFPFYEKIMN